ncbi:MAG: DUF4136 domain-containing protein [Bacteroidota bacterium]
MKYIIGIILLISLCLGGCQSARLVSAENLSRSNTNDLETFAFAKLEKRVKVNRVDTEKTRAVLEQAVINKMEEAGYAYSEENPDLLLDLQLNYIKSSRNQARSNYYSPYPRYYYGRYAYGDLQGERFAREANIIASIEILFAANDADKKLWKGTSETKLVGRLDKRIERLEMAIERLVAAFEVGEEK